MKFFLLSIFILSIILPKLALASFDVNLKYGSRGAAVIDLQKFLQNQGFFKSKATGRYGPITLNAVKAFQYAYGLTSDGYFGKASRAKASILANVGTTPTISTNVNSKIINTPFAGTLDLIKNISYANQPATAPKIKFKLASFSLTNNTTEMINLNNIEAVLTVNNDSSFISFYIKNLYAVYGDNTTFVNSAYGNNYWAVDSQLGIGQTIILSLYGDISPSIPLNAVINSKILVSGVSAMSLTNVYTNSNAVLSGQDITIGTSSLAVKEDSSTPPPGSFVPSQKITAGKFQFTSTADAYNVSELKFIVPGLNNTLSIKEVVLTDNATGLVLATGLIKTDYTNNYSTFDFNVNIPIPINSSKSVTLVYHFNKIINSNITNINIAPILIYTKALNSTGAAVDGVAGNYKNLFISSGGISLPAGGITVNSLRIFKSLPMLTHIPLNNLKISNGSTPPFSKFSIKADSNGDISIKQLTLLVTISDPDKNNFHLNNFTFWKENTDYTGSVAIGQVFYNNFLGLGGARGISSGITNNVAINFVLEEIIPAGQTETYTLKALFNNFISPSNSVSVSFPSDTEMLDSGRYLKTVFSKFYPGLAQTNMDLATTNYYNFLWSDMSELYPNPHNIFNGSYTNDWYNGFGILNLPLTSQTVTAQ